MIGYKFILPVPIILILTGFSLNVALAQTVEVPEPPTEQVVLPSVKIFWSQGESKDLKLQYLIASNNVGVQPIAFQWDCCPPEIEVGDLIEVALEQPKETKANVNVTGVTATALGKDQFGSIIGVTGNRIPLKQVTQDRYSLEVKPGLYAITVYTKVSDVNMTAVYTAPINAVTQLTT